MNWATYAGPRCSWSKPCAVGTRAVVLAARQLGQPAPGPVLQCRLWLRLRPMLASRDSDLCQAAPTGRQPTNQPTNQPNKQTSKAPPGQLRPSPPAADSVLCQAAPQDWQIPPWQIRRQVPLRRLFSMEFPDSRSNASCRHVELSVPRTSNNGRNRAERFLLGCSAAARAA